MGWRERLDRMVRGARGGGADDADSRADDRGAGPEAFHDDIPGDAEAGLRSVTAPLDQWFAREVHQLEEEARASAADWAQAGLPRADARPEGELPPEQALRRRASEVFGQWVQKVTTRVQDALENEVQRVRQSLNDLSFSLEEMRRGRDEGAEVEARVAELEESDRSRESSFGFRSYWHWGWFVPAIVLLVVVDWVANVPVFQELLPQDADFADAWQVLAAQAELEGAWAGLYRMWYRITLAPEVALLALGVIIFLVILAHIFGESLRRIVAVNEKDAPDAGHRVRQYRRQFWIPAGFGLVGGVLVISFLFLARQEIASFAETRLTGVQERIEQLDERIETATEAGEINEVARLSAMRPALEDELEQREERRAYAERIRATNVPIAILNSVLFMTAALLGYLKVHDRVTAADPKDPRMADLLERRRDLRAHVQEHRERAREADRDAREGIARAEYLAQARPFEDWEGRRERLARVISVFRAENARIRGVDPQHVASFRTETGFEVEPPRAEGRFRLPDDFGGVKERHRALLREWREIDGPQAPEADRTAGDAGRLPAAGATGGPDAGQPPRPRPDVRTGAPPRTGERRRGVDV